jgi:acyl carrier protein
MTNASAEASSDNKTTDINQIELDLHAFIEKNFIIGEDEKISSDVSLIETGIMDSTSALELVDFIETTYHISVSDRELNPDNLETIARIARFVAAKAHEKS